MRDLTLDQFTAQMSKLGLRVVSIHRGDRRREVYVRDPRQNPKYADLAPLVATVTPFRDTLAVYK